MYIVTAESMECDVTPEILVVNVMIYTRQVLPFNRDKTESIF
jgi:hypothetical protein